MIHFLTMGTVLGLSAGFAPGPLLTLVISETLQHGVQSGVKVALSPMVTDLPIIFVTLFVLSKIAHFQTVLGIISLIGGLFVLFMGCQSMRTKGLALNLQEPAPKSLTKGVLVNVLSPYPYLFWLSVGAPAMAKAMNHNALAAVAFITSFYVFLVGSKIVLALLFGRTKFLLTSKAYLFTMRFLGFALCVLAMVLFRDGLNLLNSSQP